MNTRTLIALLRQRSTLRRHDAWTRAELEEHQASALRALRDFAVGFSPFYRDLHRGLGSRPLQELPVVTKAMMMGSFDDFVTDSLHLSEVEEHLAQKPSELFRDRYRIAATSGSTGLRGIFLSDPEEWTNVLASYARAHAWAGLKAGFSRRTKIAVVSSKTPWHQSAIVGATLQSRWVQTLRLDATESLDRIVAELEAFAPEALVGYASMIRALAEEQIAGRLHIRPSAVMCSSEVLTEESARRIDQAWGAPPFEVYAATETAGIASHCEHHRLHLYEDLVITEIVDSENRPVPAGVYGDKVLVTVLFSRTQPLIRYEMSDSVAWSAEACECGRPFALLEGVQGRREDTLRMAGRDAREIDVHPLVIHRGIEGLVARGWQVVQERDRLLVLVEGAAEDADLAQVAAHLRSALVAHGALPPPIVIERVQRIPRSALGKAPLIRAIDPLEGRVP